MADCLISFGSNQGDGGQAFVGIGDAFRSHPRIGDVRTSNLFSTRPIGGTDSPANYLNAAIRISTVLDPPELLRWLLTIERQWERVRTKRWGPRSVDLDLLLYDREFFRQPIDGDNVLVVPHPRMTFRRFVLTPAVEIAEEMFHPLAGATIGELLKHLDRTANGIALVGDPLRTQAVLDAIESQRIALADCSTDNAAGLEYSFEVPSVFVPFEFPSTGHRFAILLVDSAEKWSPLRRDIKLLVYWRRDVESSGTDFVRGAVGEFVGPRLELETDEGRAAADEIAAAMAAMLPSSVVE